MVNVLALVDLVQDLDVLTPVLLRLNETPEVRLKVVVSRWLARRAPRVPRVLSAYQLDFRYVARPDLLAGRAPSLDSVDVLLTAAESSESPHRWSHALALRAKARGCATFSLQHGLDNLEALGRAALPDDYVASDTLFCWCPEQSLPPDLSPRVRARISCVGRPTISTSPRAPRFDLGVFENLHAKVYGDGERSVFLERLLRLIAERPALRVLIKTHPAGGWLDQHERRLRRFPNVTYLSSKAARTDPQEGDSSVALAARIIATPSTVVLDAASRGRPVALALNGGGLYSPLPLLQSGEDWLTFADAKSDTDELGRAFLARHLRTGDAVERIVTRLTTSQRKSMPTATVQATEATDHDGQGTGR